jgi:hypothetical protein
MDGTAFKDSEGRLVTAHVAEIEDGSSTELQSKRSDRTCKTLSGIASELATIRGRYVSDLVDRQAAIVTTTTDCLRVAGLAVAEHDSDKLGERQVRAYQDTSTQRQQVNPESRTPLLALRAGKLSSVARLK